MKAQLKTPELRALALSALLRQLPELQAREQKMIPLPATWINAQRWEGGVSAEHPVFRKPTVSDQAIDDLWTEEEKGAC